MLIGDVNMANSHLIDQGEVFSKIENKYLIELREKFLILSLMEIPVGSITLALIDLKNLLSERRNGEAYNKTLKNYPRIHYVENYYFNDYGRQMIFNSKTSERRFHIMNFLLHSALPFNENIYNKWKKMEKDGYFTISYFDSDYPQLLREIKDPPVILYCRGDKSVLNCDKFTMVGNRKASSYGLRLAQNFAKELSFAGFAIVSGLALGIDGASHKGAIKATGKTIAVLPCGIDRVYPHNHKNLAEDIVKKGLLITEFPPKSQVRKYHFLLRNRILSALSEASLVVEAEKKSGSMITARCVGEQGRTLYAIPGNIDQPRSKGTNYLIRNGAILVSGLEDILEDFPRVSYNACNIFNFESEKKSKETIVNNSLKNEMDLFNMLKEQPMDVNEIKRTLNIDYSKVWSYITRLEINSKIYRDGSGKYYVN